MFYFSQRADSWGKTDDARLSMAIADSITSQESERFDSVESEEVTTTPRRGILKMLCNIPHIVCLVQLAYTLDLAIGLALTLYGLTIGMVVGALRMTRDRNVQLTYYYDRLREGL